MPFQFYTNMLSRASRSVAAGVMVIGLLLIGFGTLIAALPELFAYMAAAVFFIAGIGCAIAAIKIFWIQRRIERLDADDIEPYRKNVRVHTGNRQDF